MTTVVTGAAGHVGANLVRALACAGRSVRAMVYRDRRALEGLAVEHAEAGIRDYDSVRRVCEGADTVFHLASRISIVGGESGLVSATNVQGTANVTRACLELGVRRLVHFGSVHGLEQGRRGEPICESNGPNESGAAGAYDRSKAEGVCVVAEAVAQGLDAVTVLPTAVLGPHDYKPSRMGRVLLDLYHRRLPAVTAGGFHWVDVRDVVAGALAAEDCGRKGDTYLLSGEYLMVSELVSLVEEVTGIKRPRLVTPMWLARAAAPCALAWARLRGKDPRFTPESIRALRWNPLLSCAKAERDLDYRPRPIDETIRDTFEWFGAMGWLEPGWRPSPWA